MVDNHEDLIFWSVEDAVGVLFQFLICIDDIVVVPESTGRAAHEEWDLLGVGACDFRNKQEGISQQEPGSRWDRLIIT